MLLVTMATLVRTCSLSARRKLPWSNGRQAWEERLGAAILLAGIAIARWSASRLTLWQQAGLWTLLLVAVGLLLRRGWLKLLGPLFLFELVRAGRRSRYTLLRLYVYLVLIILLYILTLCLAGWWADYGPMLTVPATQAAGIFQSFFFFFMSVHVILVVLVTPGYTAGAIAGEKDRRTLEPLLATDLRNREIVLSKLAVRLANLTLMLLTGLPIVVLLQFLSGIDPELVLAGLIATGLTMGSLASLGILNSVYARKSRDAILYTYLEMAAYGLLSAFSQLLQMTPLAARKFDWGQLSVTVGDAIDWFSAGNPFIVMGKVINLANGGTILALSLLGILRDYAVLHAVLAVLFAAWAALRLRTAFLKQASGGKQAATARRVRSRRRVGNWPMVWKETLVGSGLRFNWFGRILMVLFIIASFVPALLIGSNPGKKLAAMTEWALAAGATVSCLLLLGVAVRSCRRASAASAIG